jgi:hypothetical protein
MDLGDPTSRRHIGIAANAVGLVLLLGFLLVGPRAFGTPALAWGTFLVGVALTAVGIAMLRMGTRAGE